MDPTGYYFIIKDQTEEFEGQFTYLEEKTSKYKIFSIPVENEVKRIGKNVEGILKTLSYRF